MMVNLTSPMATSSNTSKAGLTGRWPIDRLFNQGSRNGRRGVLHIEALVITIGRRTCVIH